MILAHDIAHAVTLAHGRNRLGKAFKWSERPFISGFTEDSSLRFQASGTSGHWIEDGASAQQKEYRFGEYVCEDMERRLKLRETLSLNPYLALIAGVLRDDLRQQFESVGENLSLPGMHARNKKTLLDAPRSYMTLDLDKLDLSERVGYDDVFEADSRLPNIIHDLFDEMGLNWLICDSIMVLSSSHGIRDPKVMGVHLDYQLAKPLTLLEQKHIVTYINEQATKSGLLPEGKELCDTKIYDPARLLFTAPAELRMYVDTDTGTVTRLVKPPYQRVRAIKRGQPCVEDIPEEAFKIINRAAKVAKAREMTRRGDAQARAFGAAAAGKRNDRTLVPGRVHENTNARIFAVVNNTPLHRLEAEKKRLVAQLTKEVLAIDDGDAHKTEQRLRTVSGDEFERSWRGAMETRHGYEIVRDMETKHKSGHSVTATREALHKHLSALIRKAVENAHQDDDTKELPKHTLIQVPPGIGKTHAALAAINTEMLMSKRLAYLTPRVDLSSEARTRMLKQVGQDEYTQSRVRHHEGRDKLCKEPEYGKLAARVENVGLSPLLSVCAYCPRKDACKWPQQHADKESGIVFGQHAHATSSLAKIRSMDAPNAPNVGIVDESMLSTLVRSSVPVYKLSTLDKQAKRVTFTSRKGQSMFSKTNDMVGYRSRLMDALKASDELVMLDKLATFRKYETVHNNGNTQTKSQIDWALELEQEAMWAFNKQLTDALKTYHDAKAAGKNVKLPRVEVARLANQIRYCNWFMEAFRSVKGSLGVEGRQHVFGMRVRKGKIHITLRAELPAVMMERDWVWMDGTANAEVWAALLAHANVRVSRVSLSAAEGPYKLIQYADKPYSKRMFSADRIEDSRSNIHKLLNYVRRQAARHARVLLVCQKVIEDRLKPHLPENVDTMHFNAQRGRDDFKGHDCAIIVGRPMPSTDALETYTEALHFDDVETPGLVKATERMNREPRTLKLTGQREVRIMSESHPDRRVAAMLNQIADSEVLQAIHRLRLYDRTERNPAEIHVFGQANTGLTISELRGWIDVESDEADQIIAGGVIPGQPELISRLIPGRTLGSARNLLTQARKRATDWEEVKVRVPGINGICRVLARPGMTETQIVRALS